MDFEYNELEEIEYKINKIEKEIKELWDNVMVPYLNNYNRQILINLTENDYIKFYEFIIKNNSDIKSLYNRYYDLINKGNN